MAAAPPWQATACHATLALLASMSSSSRCVMPHRSKLIGNAWMLIPLLQKAQNVSRIGLVSRVLPTAALLAHLCCKLLSMTKEC